MSFFDVPKLQDVRLVGEYRTVCNDMMSSNPSKNARLVAIARFIEKHYLGIDPDIRVHEFSFKSHIHIPGFINNDTGYYRFYGSGSAKAVVVVPPRNTSYYNIARLIAAYLASNGFNAYEIVTPLHQARLPDGARSVVGLPVDTKTLNLVSRQSVEEILGLVGLITEKCIGIVAVSQGTAYATIARALDPKIASSVYIHGFGGLADILVHSRDRFARHFRNVEQKRNGTIDQRVLAQALEDVEPLNYVKKGDASTTFMVNAKNDEVLPENNVRNLWEALGNPEIKWFSIPGLDGHKYLAIRTKKILEMTLGHLQRTLK